jgi:acyl carrier protein
MVFERIAEILAEQLSIDVERIALDSLLEEDLDAGSFDIIDVVMSIEDEFRIEVLDEAIAQWKTVENIVNFIENNQ